MSWGDWEYHPQRPRQARGGIKSRSRRGRFGLNWWSRRWFELIDGFDIGQRVGRGRSYARRGQATQIEIRPGRVNARVQGSRRTPYRVEIAVPTLDRDQHERLRRAVLDRPILAARLLAGEFPEQLDFSLGRAELSLFPSEGFATDCSCPDWSNPCKHIVAILLLLGEEFDRDPFLIMQLRGVTREGLLVGPKQRSKIPNGGSRARCDKTRSAAEAGDPLDLPLEPDQFWGQPDCWEIGPESLRDTDALAIQRQLGEFPFWRGSDRLAPALERIYSQARQVGLQILAGERGR